MSVDISGLVLKQILLNPSSEESIAAWAKLKAVYFSAEYTSIYTALNKYYTKYSEIPSFNDLFVSIRENLLVNKFRALENLSLPVDVNLELSVEALINEYAQKETLIKIDKFIDNIVLLDAEEFIFVRFDDILAVVKG